ncbi:MAG: anthranilate synthase component I [Spirochaetes bacterium]|nr:anthranilate synthase component I [Spirochaetota bacterium]
MIQTKNIEKNVLIKVIPGERFTPFSLFRKLDARVLLESATFGQGRGRYSILLVKEAFSILQKGENLFMEKGGKKLSLKTKAQDILDVLSHFARQHSGPEYDFPFPAGGIGYLSYEYARKFDDVNLREKIDSLGIPDAYFIFGHIFAIFDHYRDTITLIALKYSEHSVNLEKTLYDIEERIHDLDFNYLNQDRKEYTSIPLRLDSERSQFMNGVAKIKKEIIKGNLLQGVLSRRLVLRTEIPALEAYSRLRSLNPSPYMFYLNYGDFQLFGSSPELHVKVNDRKVIMRPIAGTRKRGKDKGEDEFLEHDLLSDEKELAEHLMLVDLARNDLGRICKPGSVNVSEYMGIERYSHVMHIVSQVEGTLMDGKSGLDAIRKTFPAGTVSGAPKIKAMEIIDSIEREKRSFYAGIVGYLEPDGTLDSCITIRSALKNDDLLILQAGAGIVFDSIPEKEYEETSSKLRALEKAIGVEV